MDKLFTRYKICANMKFKYVMDWTEANVSSLSFSLDLLQSLSIPGPLSLGVSSRSLPSLTHRLTKFLLLSLFLFSCSLSLPPPPSSCLPPSKLIEHTHTLCLPPYLSVRAERAYKHTHTHSLSPSLREGGRERGV